MYARMSLTVIAGENAGGDLCTDMGASGTYEAWINGEYAADTDKGCFNSGAATADPTSPSAGVAGAAGKINGDNGFLFDAAGEHIRYIDGAVSQTIDTAGTIQVTVITPGSYSHEMVFAEIYTDANNNAQIYTDATGRLFGHHEGGGDSDFVGACTALTVGTEYTLVYTWNGTEHSISVDGGSTWCDNDQDSPTPFAGTVDDIGLGESQYLTNYDGTDGWKVDDVQFREGYEGD